MTEKVRSNIWDPLLKAWPVLTVLVPSVFFMGIWVKGVQDHMDANEKADNKHHNDAELHMPYSDKIREFIPRTMYMEDRRIMLQDLREIDGRQRQILEAIARLEEKIDSLKKKVGP